MNVSASAAHPYSLDLRALFAVMLLGFVMFSPAQSYAGASEGPALLAAAAEIPLEATADSITLVASQVDEVSAALADVATAYLSFFSLDEVPQAAAAALVPGQSVTAGESLLMTLAYVPESLYETVGSATDFMAAVEMAPVYVITDALSETLFKAGIY